MNILLPTTITEAMIAEGTNIPSVDTSQGEILWIPEGEYKVDDLRVFDGAVYSCVKQNNATSASPTPPNDPTNWLFKEPANRMCPFDDYLFTQARRLEEVKYVIRPGFFDGFWLGGVDADTVEYTVRDNGSVVISSAKDMYEQAFGEWEYLFGNLRKDTKLSKNKIPINPSAELELRFLRNKNDVYAKVGTISIGQWRQLLAPNRNIGGVEYGVEVTPKSYAFFKQNADGTYTRTKGRQAKIITASVLIDSREAPAVSDLLDRILDVPVAVDASNLPRYGHISTYGFVKGSVVAKSFGTSVVNLKVEGNV